LGVSDNITVRELVDAGNSVTISKRGGTGRMVFMTRDGREIMSIEPDGRLRRGAAFATDDAASVALFACLDDLAGKRGS
jgi:hypothetical protein